MFTRGIYSLPLASVFAVKVGAVSGADEIFSNEELANADFVCSKTAQTGATRRMIYLDREGPLPYLEQFKERLLARRVTRFDESNWWKWGRRHHVSDAPRIYVNQQDAQPRALLPASLQQLRRRRAGAVSASHDDESGRPRSA